ncbi:MAG: hypothetical protein ACR2KE_06745 [Candidatus Nanopelagicales bacterium]
MPVRRALVLAVAVFSLPLLVALPSQAQERAEVLKTLDFRIDLQPAGSDTYALPGDVSYGQGRLVGTTTWGRRPAMVDWMCSHVSSGGVGPANDLITVTRSDGAVLALSVTGWVADGTLRGTVQVLGGKGAYRGATGTGTVVGHEGSARLSLAVSQGGGRALPRHGVGC